KYFTTGRFWSSYGRTPSHLKLKGNDDADIAAKRGLELPTITRLPPSVSETYSAIKTFCNNLWQRIWDTSIKGRFLYYIQPKATTQFITPSVLNKHDSLIVNRLFTGRTKLPTSFGRYIKLKTPQPS
ncbi:hypothetical protein CHS0354_041043, partial [Potamilus streckersoni]